MGLMQNVWMFEAIQFMNGRFYFKVNNYKDTAKNGVNYLFCLSKLNFKVKTQTICGSVSA